MYIVDYEINHFLGNVEEVFNFGIRENKTPAFLVNGYPVIWKNFGKNSILAQRYSKEVELFDEILEKPDYLKNRKIAVIASSGLSEIELSKPFVPYKNSHYLTNKVLSHIVRKWKIEEYCFCTYNACASIFPDFYIAKQLLKEVDFVILAFSAANILINSLPIYEMMGVCFKTEEPEKSSRPFDRERKGFVIASGAYLLVLTKKEIAKDFNFKVKISEFHWIYDSFKNNLFHLTKDGLKKLLKKFSLENLDWIKAHGSGTKLNDKIECEVFKEMEFFEIPITSFKGFVGHTLSACSGIEIALACESMKRNMIIKNVNLEEKEDNELDLIITNRKKELRRVLCLNYGFGGIIGGAILEKED